MIWMRFLPGVLKELLKHVPALLFSVVEWKELSSELPKLSQRILQKEGFKDLLDDQRERLAHFGVCLREEPATDPDYFVSKENGEKILGLYFAQLFSTKGVFLDLRNSHFSEALNFHPSGLWTKFSDSFQRGILEVYEGFYLEDEDLYMQGLLGLGLLNPSWGTSEKKELADLFKDQFGSAQTEEVKFELEKFTNSIIRMTEFLIEKKVKINPDFLYLGIYLVTLYSHLDQCKEALPVKRVYLSVRESNAKQS
jgi:hypothetical protein